MLKFRSSMLCTSKIHAFFTRELLGNFMIIRVTSVEWTWLGSEWPLPSIWCLVHGWYNITSILMLNFMHHCCLVSYYRALYILLLMKLLVFKKLVRNLDKMIVASLGRQHQKSLDSHIKSSWEYMHLFGVICFYLIPSILLKLIVYIFKLVLLKFWYSLNNRTTLRHLLH